MAILAGSRRTSDRVRPSKVRILLRKEGQEFWGNPETMARKGRQLENRPTRDRDDREPIVTYSRLEADRLGSPHDFDEFEPAGPLYEAVEVPRVDRPPPRDAFIPEPELRAERAAIDPEPFEAEERPRRLRYLVMIGIGVIAIAAGIGVLLASIGSSSHVETGVRAPVPAAGTANTAGTGDAVAGGSSGIRQIPIGEGDAVTPVVGSVPADAADAQPAVAVDPPAPRLRPDRPPAATVSAQPGNAGTGDAGTAAAAAPAAAASGPADNDAAFISRIEKTLADIDAARGAPGPGTAPAAAAAPPATVAPAALPADPSPTDPSVIGGEDGPVMDGDGAAMDGDGAFDAGPTDAVAGTQAGTVTGPLPTPPGTIDAGALLGTTTPDVQPIPPRLIPPADIPNVPATGTAN